MWGFFVQGSHRLLWLENLVERRRRNADQSPPTHIGDGVVFDDVSFAYPGANQPLVLEHINLRLPAGSVVAVVGENRSGQIDARQAPGQALRTDKRPHPHRPDRPRHYRRSAMAGADGRRVPDFVRFELPAQGSIGLGDLPRVDDADAVTGAVVRAGAADVIERLPRGPRHPTRPKLAGRGRPLGRAVAEGGACPWARAQRPAPRGARRADLGARCGNRTHALRALCRNRARIALERPGRVTAPRLPSLLDSAHGRPHRRAVRHQRCRGGQP